MPDLTPLPVGFPPINFGVHAIRTGSDEGARADFEDMIGQLVRVAHPGVRTVEANPGDWGIDAFVGELVGEISVWQSKFFIDGVSDPQKAQIRESFKSAVDAATSHGHSIKLWILCIPVSMDGPTTKWWDAWRKKKQKETGIKIELWDRTELLGLLHSPDAENVRSAYYDSYNSSSSRVPPRPIADIEHPEQLDSALFVRQLQDAGHTEMDAAKQQFFNADLMAREITDKAVPRELSALGTADATVHALWEARFNEGCQTVPDRVLPGLHAAVMRDVRGERDSLAPPLRASLVHLYGLVHRVVDDGRAGWVRDWRDVAADHGQMPLAEHGSLTSAASDGATESDDLGPVAAS